MKFCRVRTTSGNEIWAKYSPETLREITSAPWLTGWQLTGRSLSLEDVEFLAPCESEKVIGVAQNYHAAENSSDTDKPIIYFIKAAGAITRADQPVRLPDPQEDVWGEAELAFMIGADSASKTGFSIFGYLLANDITRANTGGLDHHLAYSKSPYGFCPVSHLIDTDFIPGQQKVYAYQNDVLLREARLSQRIMSDQQILSDLANWFPLSPGDLVLTGAPPRVRSRLYLKPGDKYECRIEGLGNLITKIAR